MKTYRFELSTGATVQVEASTPAEAERIMWAGLYAVLDAATAATVTLLAGPEVVSGRTGTRISITD